MIFNTAAKARLCLVFPSLQSCQAALPQSAQLHSAHEIPSEAFRAGHRSGDFQVLKSGPFRRPPFSQVLPASGSAGCAPARWDAEHQTCSNKIISEKSESNLAGFIKFFSQ